MRLTAGQQHRQTMADRHFRLKHNDCFGYVNYSAKPKTSDHSITKTAKDIVYVTMPYGKRVVIPKHTKVYPATNLPEKDKYWVEDWVGMSDEEKSWNRNYGFLVSKQELEV